MVAKTISIQANIIEGPGGSDITLTTPSIRYSNTNIDAHWIVYRLPRKTPRIAKASGSAFKNNKVPPGLRGASQISQSKHRKKSPHKLKDALRCSATFKVTGDCDEWLISDILCAAFR